MAQIGNEVPDAINTIFHHGQEDGWMNVDTTTVKLLGVAQLTVFIASLISECLLETSVGTGTIEERL